MSEVSEQLPRVSFVVLCYNQEKFVGEAVKAALAQDYPNLEVLVSDDCSSDGTLEVVNDVVGKYVGSKSVRVNSNEVNLGIAEHVNAVWRLVTGEFVIFQAGDDISSRERASELVAEWLRLGRRVDLVSSLYDCIDDNGLPVARPAFPVVSVPPLKDLVLGGKSAFLLQGCVNGYARRLHETVGPLPSSAIFEDAVYSFRSCLGGGFSRVNKSLLLYRIHPQTVMSQFFDEAKEFHAGLGPKLLKVSIGLLEDRLCALKVYGKGGVWLRFRLLRLLRTQRMLFRFCSSNALGRVCLLFLSLVSLRFRAARVMWNGLRAEAVQRTTRHG